MARDEFLLGRNGGGLVASLLDDDVPPDDVSAFYPSVSSDGARGAVAFARYVDEYREYPKAA
jgi:hypothetical protein